MTVNKNILPSRDEWLIARGTRIGGSDSSSIVGMNPYKTNVELWLEKTGQKTAKDISDKPYVIYGTKAERPLRELFELDFPNLKVFYEENNLFTNDHYPFAHASLDGWLEDEEGKRGILEIKTTNILQSMQREKWNGQVPDNYYVQILHNMMVYEADFAVLKAQLKSEFKGELSFQTKHYFFERLEVMDDIDYLIEKEKEFYKHIQDKSQPPLMLPEI